MNDIARGDAAQRILDDEIYRDAVATVRQNIFKKWADAPIRDAEGQHELKLMLHLLDSLESMLKTVMETGKLERSRLEQAKDVLKRWR